MSGPTKEGCCYNGRRLIFIISCCYCFILLNHMAAAAAENKTDTKETGTKQDEALMKAFFDQKPKEVVSGKIWLVVLLFGALPLLICIIIFVIIFLCWRARARKKESQASQQEWDIEGDQQDGTTTGMTAEGGETAYDGQAESDYQAEDGDESGYQEQEGNWDEGTTQQETQQSQEGGAGGGDNQQI